MDMTKYHLRIFLNSICNLKCFYCNPNGDREKGPSEISTIEIKEIIQAAYTNGIRKIHYSGGEPLLRKDLLEIVSYANACGFKEQVITTNGVLLDKQICRNLRKNGLSRITISLDSWNKSTYKQITGHDFIDNVIDSIEYSLQIFDQVKINVVVTTQNIIEVPDFIQKALDSNGKLIPRFIELQNNQPIFYDNESNMDHFRVLKIDILNQIRQSFYDDICKSYIHGENPNIEYFSIKGYANFGIIANHSRGYPCGNCFKFRISPQGYFSDCISTDKSKKIVGLDLERKTELIAEALNLRERNSPRKGFHLSEDYGYWRWGNRDDFERKTKKK